MKKLNLFQQFNFGAWAKDKQFMIQSIKWNDKKGCVNIDVIITEDNTDYGDENVSNIFEKFKVALDRITILRVPKITDMENFKEVVDCGAVG